MNPITVLTLLVVFLPMQVWTSEIIETRKIDPSSNVTDDGFLKYYKVLSADPGIPDEIRRFANGRILALRRKIQSEGLAKEWPLVWTVMKGSETFTLAEFIFSSRLCAIVGHRWEVRVNFHHETIVCSLCYRPHREKGSPPRIDFEWKP